LAVLLIKRARGLYAGEQIEVELQQSVYALDSTTIDLCLNRHNWEDVAGRLLQNRECPLNSFVVRRPDELSLLSINKAKGLDSLAVIMIDVASIDKLFTAQEQMDYSMGASRARPLLAILHRES
jgi:hypothetical protein